MTGPAGSTPEPKLKGLRGVRRPAIIFVAVALALILGSAYWYWTAPSGGLAVVKDEGGTNLCYAAIHAERIVLREPVVRDISARSSGCLLWPSVSTPGTAAKFTVELAGSFGRKKTLVSDAIVVAAPTSSAALPSPRSSTIAVPGPLPSPSSEALPNSIVGPVLTYYADWDRRRFDAMWQLLSPAFRGRTTYTAWLALHTFNTSIAVTSSRRVGPSQIAVTVAATEVDGHGKVVHTTNAVTWSLVFANGHWLLDSAI